MFKEEFLFLMSLVHSKIVHKEAYQAEMLKLIHHVGIQYKKKKLNTLLSSLYIFRRCSF